MAALHSRITFYFILKVINDNENSEDVMCFIEKYYS